jgi:Core-2/I-Branching enzyme
MSERKVAFLILAHTDKVMLDRLLSALPPGSPKIVHVDRKSSEFDDFVPQSSNTHMVSRRVAVHWAGFSVVEATLELMRLGLACTDAQRFVLLSGQSYPLKSNDAIISFFDSHDDREFIRYFNIESADQHYIDKLEAYFFSEDVVPTVLHHSHARTRKFISRAASRAGRMVRRNWRTQLKGLAPAFGSQWWALTRACVEHAVRTSAERPELAFYRYSFAPDEMYFHTIVANSPFHLRAGGFEPYRGRGNWKLNDLHLLNSKGSLHKIYTLDDWDEIESSRRLFLRKLTSLQSMSLIEKIEGCLRLV